MAVTMWKARDRRNMQEVVLRGYAYEQGQDIYHPAKHRGFLQCAFCEAAVFYCNGSPAVGGGLRGPSGHFKTFQRHVHSQDCKWNFDVREPHAVKPVDKTKGYRLNLNTCHGAFGVAALRHYDVNENGRPVLIDQNLSGRESVSIKSAQDVVGFLQRADIDRIDDTVIVGPDHDPDDAIYWSKFFIRYAKKGPQLRFLQLWVDNRYKAMCPPVCMVFPLLGDSAQPRESSIRDSVQMKSMVRGRMIVLAKDIVGTREHVNILPRLYLENQYTVSRFPLDKAVIVLGRPRFKLLKPYVWALNFSASSSNAFAVYDQETLSDRVRARAQRNRSQELSLA